MHLVAQWEKNLWPRSCRCLQAQVQELMSSSTCNDSAQVRRGTRTRTGGIPNLGGEAGCNAEQSQAWRVDTAHLLAPSAMWEELTVW